MVCSLLRGSSFGGPSQTSKLSQSANKTFFPPVSNSQYSRDDRSKKPSIPVNYGPAPFKRRYRKCSGDPHSIMPKLFGARSLPINAKGVSCTTRVTQFPGACQNATNGRGSLAIQRCESGVSPYGERAGCFTDNCGQGGVQGADAKRTCNEDSQPSGHTISRRLWRPSRM